MKPINIASSYHVDFSPDGRHCIATGREVNLWSLDSGKKTWKAKPFTNPTTASFSSDGSSLVVKSLEGKIAVLDAATGKVLHQFSEKNSGEGSNALFSPCGGYLLDAVWGGHFVVRELASGKKTFEKPFEDEHIQRILTMPDADFVLTEHHPVADDGFSEPADDYFCKWAWPWKDAASRRLAPTFPFLTASALSPCGSRVAVVYDSGSKLAVLSLETEQIVWKKKVEASEEGGAIAWSPDGNLLAMIDEDERVAVYTSKAGKRRGLVPTILEDPCCLAFSPDQSHLAIGAWSKGVIIDFDPSALD